MSRRLAIRIKVSVKNVIHRARRHQVMVRPGLQLRQTHHAGETVYLVGVGGSGKRGRQFPGIVLERARGGIRRASRQGRRYPPRRAHDRVPEPGHRARGPRAVLPARREAQVQLPRVNVIEDVVVVGEPRVVDRDYFAIPRK